MLACKVWLQINFNSSFCLNRIWKTESGVFCASPLIKENKTGELTPFHSFLFRAILWRLHCVILPCFMVLLKEWCYLLILDSTTPWRRLKPFLHSRDTRKFSCLLSTEWPCSTDPHNFERFLKYFFTIVSDGILGLLSLLAPIYFFWIEGTISLLSGSWEQSGHSVEGPAAVF